MRQRNKEKEAETSRKWKKEHPDKVTATKRKWYRRHPDKVKADWLRRRYGMTLEEYRYLLVSQGGVCAICAHPETRKNPKNNKVYDMAIDHNHKTGKVRGLLCTACNNGLKCFRDNSKLLWWAIHYLENKEEL